MRIIYLLFGIVLLSFSSSAQVKKREFKFPEIGWSISIPNDFRIIDSSIVDSMSRKGLDYIEKTYDTTFNFGSSKTLISITRGKFDFLAAILSPLDTYQIANWNEGKNTMIQAIIETFKSQAPDLKVDTTTSTLNIDGILFSKFQATATYPNKMILNVCMLNALCKSFDLSISYRYADNETGKQLNEILTTSKFRK